MRRSQRRRRGTSRVGAPLLRPVADTGEATAAATAVEAEAWVVPEGLAVAFRACDHNARRIGRHPKLASSTLYLVALTQRHRLDRATLAADQARPALQPREFIQPRQVEVQGTRLASAIDRIHSEWDGRRPHPIPSPHDFLLCWRLLDEDETSFESRQSCQQDPLHGFACVRKDAGTIHLVLLHRAVWVSLLRDFPPTFETTLARHIARAHWPARHFWRLRYVNVP